MKTKFKIICFTTILFIFSKISFAANDENIYDKIDLFGEVLDKINKKRLKFVKFKKINISSSKLRKI